MLYAELHAKVGEEALEAERAEDVLTSTVFGTLFTAAEAGAGWESLTAWLRCARSLQGQTAPVPRVVTELEYWFWPRLREAEPDVVMQIGELLIVVEAKYFANKSSSGVAGHERDQLAREWRSCGEEAAVGGTGARAGVSLAIATCRERVLIYLVRRIRWRQAREELAASLAVVPDARLYLLAWEDLDPVLETVPARWSKELQAYLQRRRLSAFRGFVQVARPGTGHGLGDWRARRDERAWAWMLPGERLARLAELRGRDSRGAATATSPVWTRALPAERLTSIAAMARWRNGHEKGARNG